MTEPDSQIKEAALCQCGHAKSEHNTPLIDTENVNWGNVSCDHVECRCNTFTPIQVKAVEPARVQNSVQGPTP